MKKNLAQKTFPFITLVGFILIIVLSLFSLEKAINTSGSPPSDFSRLVPLAQKFINLLAENKWTEATALFDQVMLKALPAEKLARIWTQLTKQYGPFKGQGVTSTQVVGRYRLVYVECKFTKNSLSAKVVFDQQAKIAGLFFLPFTPPQPYAAPSYVKTSSFVEKEVSIGQSPWILPGVLTLPRSKGPKPAVVLVHGSGPNDRDETIGPNKPFKDLAWGLASRGLAVLRYDKRTKVYAQELAQKKILMTVEEEVIEDALQAINFLKKQPQIKTDCLFLLGHSLGGLLAPRIAQRATSLRGIIIMAGPTVSLEKVIVRQLKYLAWLDGHLSPEDKKKISEAEAAAREIEAALSKKDLNLSRRFFGASLKYWIDLKKYDPIQTAASLSCALLILQGGRDYQVTKEDFQGWQKGLQKKPRVTFKLYPYLNHLFFPGKGPSSPAEYEKNGHVALEVIEDITDWIKAQCF